MGSLPVPSQIDVLYVPARPREMTSEARRLPTGIGHHVAQDVVNGGKLHLLVVERERLRFEQPLLRACENWRSRTVDQPTQSLGAARSPDSDLLRSEELSRGFHER